jgi:hypothetical protein
MQCPKCRFENRPEARFCKQCGQSMPVAAPPPQSAPAGVPCPTCGAMVNPGARFCQGCGNTLLAASSAPPPVSPAARSQAAPTLARQAPQYTSPPTQPPSVQQPYAPHAAQPLAYFPGAEPSAASRSRWLWLGGGVALLCIVTLIGAAVVFMLNKDDSPAPQASPAATPGAPTPFDAQVSVVASAPNVAVGQPLTVTVTVSNSGQVSFDSLRYQLLEGWEPYLTTEHRVMAQETSIAPAGAGAVIFVMQAVQAGTATLQVNVTMVVRTEPESMDVRQSEKLEISVGP